MLHFARIQENADWILPVVALCLLTYWAYRRYRIDAAELAFWQRSVLLFVRVALLIGLFVFYLQPQWHRIEGSSKVVLLLDASSSMAALESGPSRFDVLKDWLQRSDLLDLLKEKHDVAVYSFAEKTLPLSPDCVPNGAETRIGEAITEILAQERGQPLSGIVILTDGAQNAGVPIDGAIEAAKRQLIPIFPVGIGAKQLPLNFRIAHFDVPERAFPNDPFSVKAKIELQGTDEIQQIHKIPVELFLGDSRVAQKEIELENVPGNAGFQPANGSAKDISFEIQPAEIGKHTLLLKLAIPEEDRLPDDNSETREIEIVDRKDKILLFAGGPMRDYQFLRTQLNRDKTMSVDVFLPWANQGVSQDAANILSEFPSNRSEMAKYDCVVAFDPDWRSLTPEQIEALEYWVARSGGGLILVAGAANLADPINGWVGDSAFDSMLSKIRALYPVDFHAKTSAVQHKMQSDTQPFAIQFSRAGEESEFLRPVDNEADSRIVWQEFTGFYSYMNVKGLKPTATLLAQSSSPDAKSADGIPILFAEQFYGGGRVLYIGSGELWRLRMLDNSYFERLTTKMLRHVSQERLKRQSELGTLSLDKQRYTLGATAAIRVMAFDAGHKPLDAKTLSVEAVTPFGKRKTLTLEPDANVSGAFSGYLALLEEGNWNFKFTLPADGAQTLSRSISVQLSDLERENPARQETLLKRMANESGGHYYDHAENAAAFVKESPLYGSLNFLGEKTADEAPPLTEQLKIRSLKSVMDEKAAGLQNWLFLWILTGTVLFEWLLRRLMRLA